MPFTDADATCSGSPGGGGLSPLEVRLESRLLMPLMPFKPVLPLLSRASLTHADGALGCDLRRHRRHHRAEVEPRQRRVLTPQQKAALVEAAGALTAKAEVALSRIEELEAAKARIEGELIDSYQELHAAEATSYALQIDLGAGEQVPTSLDQLVGQDIALATGVGPAEVARRLALAVSPDRHRVIRAMLREGKLSLYRACTIVYETRHLSDDVVSDLEEAVTSPTRDGSIRPQASFMRCLRSRAASADTRDGAERRERATAGRTAYGRIGEDGVGTMTVIASAERIVAMLDRADAMARAARAGGDPRTLEQLRSDFICDLVLFGRTSNAPRDETDAECPDASTTAAPTANSGAGTASDTSTGTASDTSTGTGTGDPAGTHRPRGGGVGADSSGGSGSAANTAAPSSTESTESTESTAAASPTPSAPPDQTSASTPAAPTTPDTSAPALDPTTGPGISEPHRWSGRPPPANVWIIVPFEVMVGASDAGCEIPGHGWVTAEHARQIMTAPGSQWRRLAVDVDTGRALELATDSYTPTRAMVEHVRAVDGVCRTPGCEVPAHRCDIDHRVPWPHGPTRISNLGPLHRGHHNPKTAGLVSLRETADHVSTGGLTWTTLAGRSYVTYPKNYREALEPTRSTTGGPLPKPAGTQTASGGHSDHRTQPVSEDSNSVPDPTLTDDDPPPF